MTIKERIPDEHVDTILDLCDNNYEEELNREKERHIRAENIFIIALGKKRFYEIKDAMEDK